MAKATAKNKAASTHAKSVHSQTTLSNQLPPTMDVAHELQRAFDYFNKDMFEGRLPQCMLTLTRLRKYAGLFAPRRWANRSEKAKANDLHEIQIDAVVLREKGDLDALSTLVHEMVHLAVEVAGYGPKRAYHCKRWAAIMNEMGLKPVAVVKGKRVEGKETGPHCDHDIVTGGAFEVSAKALLATGFQFSWGAFADPEKPKSDKPKKAGTKVKYTCTCCDNNFWGKGGMKVKCEDGGGKFIQEGGEDDGEGDDE